MAESNTNKALKVFLCHGSADKAAVRELYHRLASDGVDAWLDEVKLLGGQSWREEIPAAVHSSHVVLVCLSESSINKEGYVQQEIRFALDKAAEMPEGRIFLIPVRLEECKVPKRLSSYQWVDLFLEYGYDRLMESLRRRAEQLNLPLPGDKSRTSPGGESKTRNTRAERQELQPKKLLSLGGTMYSVQRLTGSQSSGNIIIRSAQASAQGMQEDVNILQISFAAYDQGRVESQLALAQRRAQNLNQVAVQSTHLPVIKNIIKQEPDLWVISQWIRGLSLSKYCPPDGPLPGTADMIQILGWAIDICDVLTPLHKLREVYGGLSEDAILIKRGRGAILLVDPAFAGQSLAWKLSSSPFDPRVDILALGNLLHRLLTHQSASQEPASHFNDQVPAPLEALILRMQAGPTGQTLDLKREMLRIRKGFRS